MTITRINPPALFDGTAYGMSQGTVDESSGFIFLSGQVAWDEESQVRGQGYREQAELAVKNVLTALEAAGADPSQVLHVRVYMRGELADHLPEVAPVLADTFGPHRPAVTGIGVASLATPDTLVEIEVVARRRPGA